MPLVAEVADDGVAPYPEERAGGVEECGCEGDLGCFGLGGVGSGGWGEEGRGEGGGKAEEEGGEDELVDVRVGEEVDCAEVVGGVVEEG